MTRSESHPIGSRSVGDARPPAILVVDDDRTLRTVLAGVLRKREFVVWAATGGDEAAEIYRRHGPEIDIVLSDVNMRGMTGPDTLAALRSIDPSVRCCFMTADERPATRTALLALGALAVFGKPFASLTELCESLRGYATRPVNGWEPTTEEATRWTS